MMYTEDQIEALNQIAVEIYRLDEDIRHRFGSSDYADWAADCDTAEEYCRKFGSANDADKWADLA